MQRLLVCALLALACSGHEPSNAPASEAPRAMPVIPPKPPPPKPALVAPKLRLPDDVTPLRYELRLEVDPDSDAFTGTVKIAARVNRAIDHVWLHADELDITSASYDDGPLAKLPVTGDRIVGFGFGRTLQPREVTLAFAFAGHTSHDQEGLFRQKLADRWYLYSQGESEFARRFVPCFDEPRWKTPWRVTLVVPKGHVGVANAALEHDTALPDGRHELAFAQTPAMASYLVTIAVGPFAIVDAGRVGKAGVPVRVIVPPTWREKVAVVAKQLPVVTAELEAYAGEPLPNDKIDIAVVPRFFGAMENPGLITFEAGAIVGDPKRVSGEFVRIAAHELAHQWFGNSLTPAWWDDLWLSEAFASWFGDRVAAKLGFYGNPQLHRAITRASALEADEDAAAQPLHRPIAFDPENEFDAISYDKGEAVLTTFESWLGADAFRTALRTYIAEHRGGSVTTADLVAAIGKTATPDAADVLRAFVDHAGPPIVELGLRCDGAPVLVAHGRDKLRIPLCVRYPGPKGIEHACGLAADHTEIALPAATTCPAWVLPDDFGYYETVWTTHRPRGPIPPLGKLTPAEKLVVAGDLAAAAARNDLSLHEALAELTALAGSKDTYGEYAAILLARALDTFVDDATRPVWQAWLAKRFAAHLQPDTAWKPLRGAGIEHRAAMLALVTPDHLPKATVERARRTLAASLAKGLPSDPLVVLSAGDDREAFDKLAALAKDSKDEDTRDGASEDLGWFAAPEAEAAAALASTLKPAQAWSALAPYFERGATRTAAWAALRAHLAELLAQLTAAQAGEVIDATATLCDAKIRGEVATLLATQTSRVIEGKQRLDHALAAIDRCVARRAKAGDFAAALESVP